MRETKGLSQRELGRRLGVHHNFVSSCEMGDRALNIIEVRAWCTALEVSFPEFARELDTLLAETEDENAENSMRNNEARDV